MVKQLSSEKKQDQTQRIDKWLWAARFFKTRALAVAAINNGRVKLNQQRIKPSRNIKFNDQLIISKPPYDFVVTVLSLSSQRKSAPEAQKLYQESQESIDKRYKVRLELKNQPLGAVHDQTKPDKKSRRQIIRFNRGS